ncbi:MAG: hypothetical protein WAX69_07640 [Victivallales bacterium]
MLKYIILILVDILVVIGIVAVFMHVKRRRDHRSLRNQVPGRWNWRLASAQQEPAKDIVEPVDGKDSSPQPTSRQEGIDAPVCSLCGAPMLIRAAQKGQYAGKPFYGCSKYPKCGNTAQYISLRDTKIMKSILR